MNPRPAPDTRALGQSGEDDGVAYLKRHGYRILERNFRTRHGEVDVIAREGGDLVFIEVKLRRTATFGAPQAAVDRRKQERIVRAALEYLKGRRREKENVRFDVLALGPAPSSVELIRSAFAPDGSYTY